MSGKTFERKHFFIDRKLQGRYMVSFLVPMLVMLVFMLTMLYLAADTILSATTDIMRKELEDIKVTRLLDIAEPSVQDYHDVLESSAQYLRGFTGTRDYRKAVLSSMIVIFGVGSLVIIIQIVLMTVFFSHKLAGPVYRFEMLCHAVLDGNYTDRVHLRRGDEMQNLATLLNEVNERTSGILRSVRDAESMDEKNKIIDSLKF